MGGCGSDVAKWQPENGPHVAIKQLSKFTKMSADFGRERGHTVTARGSIGVRGEVFPRALMVVRDSDFSHFLPRIIWRWQTTEYNSTRQC
jgi:hypothetical protein